MRGDPKQQKIKNLVTQLRKLGVNIKQTDHQIIVAETMTKISAHTGEIIEEKVLT